MVIWNTIKVNIYERIAWLCFHGSLSLYSLCSIRQLNRVLVLFVLQYHGWQNISAFVSNSNIGNPSND